MSLFEGLVSSFAELNETIQGVECKELVSHDDSRGFFRELIRDSDPFFGQGFKQWSHSRMAKNTVKAWHFHHKQTDWWYLGTGTVLTALIDKREESPTYGKELKFLLGDSTSTGESFTTVVKIPPGVLHACKVLTPIADLFYITNQYYDPEDEGRIPFDDAEIGYDWGDTAELIVSERDRVRHIPLYERTIT